MIRDAACRAVVVFALFCMFVGVCLAAAGLIILFVHFVAPTGVAR